MYVIHGDFYLLTYATSLQQELEKVNSQLQY